MDHSVFDGFPDGILILDREFNVKYLNAAAAAVFHLSGPRQLLGKNVLEKFPDLKSGIQDPIPEQLVFTELIFRDAKTDRNFFLFVGAQTLAGTKDILLYARDVTTEIHLQHKFKNEKFEKSRAIESALKDPLTGFYNKEGLYQQLDAYWARIQDVGGVFSILVLDLDDFKKINDTYGHPAGDKYLELYANVLRATVFERDVLGRFGGDEFVIVAKDCMAADAQRLANRILKATATFQMRIHDHSVGASVSIGMADNKLGFKSWREMFEAADKATLAAKKAGKNTASAANPAAKG